MFAKLKKKVIEENGGRAIDGGAGSPLSGSSPRPAGVGVHSPLSKDQPFSSLRSAFSTEHLAAASADEAGGRESGHSKEDLVALLTKRTEQCKKMEGNISDLAALIKDKNKTIEQLETQVKEHDEVASQRLSNQKSEFESYRDKLIAGYQEDKQALDKEKQDLARKLAEAEEYRDRFLRREADTDEVKDFTVQELAKVKHMLLMAQSELEKCRQSLESRSQQLSETQARETQLTSDLTQACDRADTLDKECARLKEDNLERAELVTSLTKEKSVFERRLDQLNAELTEKHRQVTDLNQQLSDLDSSYRALQHSTEAHKNKASQQTSKLLEEKQDHIAVLQERVATLEQRLTDHGLSGDDRLTAVQAEREKLEQKLSETRQQLTEIKSTWSDKISHLEEQISHLNTKIVEDSEELVSNQRAADSMRDNFHRQIESLRVQLEDAEKRALENYELATARDTRHEQQVKELEGELSRLRLSGVDLETQLRGKINSLEMQLTELTTAREVEQQEARHTQEQLEKQLEEAMERELQHEKAATAADLRCSELQSELSRLEEELTRVRRELDDRTLTTTGQGEKVTLLQEQVEGLQAELTAARSDTTSARRQYSESDQEKGELMVRNAQLFQQLTGLQTTLTQQRTEAEAQLSDRDTTITALQEDVEQLNHRLAHMEAQVLESASAAANSSDFESTIRSLQDQLADKTRTLRKQDQTVKDLRQTLQRELRVQALPNDDASDDNRAPSPSLSPAPPSARRQPPRHAVTPTSAAPLLTNPASFSAAAHLPVTMATLAVSSSSSSVMTGSSSSTTAAVKPMTLTSIMQVSQERGLVVRRDLEQDINFQYLKHVVLKFMLSRESEAVQLIKAVAVLLNFSHQEQQLIKQTLEWKMSWFGSRPSMGKGQKSKIIPPTF